MPRATFPTQILPSSTPDGLLIEWDLKRDGSFIRRQPRVRVIAWLTQKSLVDGCRFAKSTTPGVKLVVECGVPLRDRCLEAEKLEREGAGKKCDIPHGVGTGAAVKD